MTDKFVVVDLETTGNSAKKGDRIIQFAAVVIENGRIVDTFSSLVNPYKPIPAFIEELTGLTNEMVNGAPAFADIAPTIHALLEDAYFVAHNVLFDLSFLQEELLQAGFNGFYGPVLDTVELSRFLLPTSDSYKLSDLANQEGLEHDRPHQADSDAYVTAELFLILVESLNRLPITTLHQLLKHSGGLKSDISLLLDEYIIPKAITTPFINPNLEIVHELAIRKKQKNDLALTNKHKVATYPKTTSEKEEMFKRAFHRYENRVEQVEMMDYIYQALGSNQHLVVEAGTGVGKTVAYLLPAVIFAKQNKEKIIVSTYTTQLQEQLLTKDIPLVEKMLSEDINVVLIKGRHHYISLAKFAQSLREEDDNYDTSLTKMQVLVWLTTTETGDFEELNISSGGMLYWNRIRTSSYPATDDKMWKAYDFYSIMRQRVQEADLIITNHSILMADIATEQGILPEHHYVIVDEAHHFERTASDSFSQSLDYLTLRMLLNQTGNLELKRFFYESYQSANEIESKILQFPILLTELQVELDQLFKSVSIFASRSRKTGTNRIIKRVTLQESSKEWKALMNVAERMLFRLKDLYDLGQDVVSLGKKRQYNETFDTKSLLTELLTILDEIDKVRIRLREIFLFPSEGYVRWIETDVRAMQNLTTIYAKPIDVSSFLAKQCFSKKKSMILTSATLTVNGSFSYILNEWGLKNEDCQTMMVKSPFPYQEQVQLLIPNDLPEVNKVPLVDYVSAITEHIISIAEATKGRMMILFTSYEMLKKTYELIKESGLLEDYAIFAQGITSGSRSRLTRNFQKFDKAILLGTSSFWEGIDIPGEDLSCLVMVRLPFTPPDDPLTEARADQIKFSGGNPFNQQALPEAVLKFKQGFGRLIRTQTDRGLIIVFDRRILSSYYGKAFLSSIPLIPTKTMDINEMLEVIEEWL